MSRQVEFYSISRMYQTPCFVRDYFHMTHNRIELAIGLNSSWCVCTNDLSRRQSLSVSRHNFTMF